MMGRTGRVRRGVRRRVLGEGEGGADVLDAWLLCCVCTVGHASTLCQIHHRISCFGHTTCFVWRNRQHADVDHLLCVEYVVTHANDELISPRCYL